MPASAFTAGRWLEANHHQIVHCPNHRGRPMITRNACAKRYLRASQESFSDLESAGFFVYTVKKGLKRCLECPIGKRLARPLE